MKFSKKDLLSGLITGFYAGFIAWRIFGFLQIPSLNGFSFAWLMVLVPVLWVLGVNLGYFLGRWFDFFNQFGKFSAIGFTNAAVDFGILNYLIFYFAIAAGVWFSIFKAISFIVAAVHSYFWNKYWVFEKGRSGITGQEFFKFFAISIIATLINVLAASIVVNIIGPQFGLNAQVWANVGAVVGAATALAFSFMGFRTVVFKK